MNRPSFLRDKYFLAVLLAFVTARVVCAWLGLVFDSAYTIQVFWQLADPNLLKNDLLRTAWYLHGQPPLFNLFVGSMLKLFPEPYVAFRTIFHLLGLATACYFYASLLRLGLHRPLAAVTTILFTCGPGFLIFEHHFFYDHILVFFLTAAFFHLTAFLQTSRTRSSFAFFMFLALVVLTRSLFQGIWMLGAVALLLFRTDQRAMVLKGAAIPLLLVAMLYAKNYVVFGTTSTSSWTGMSLARMTLEPLSDHTRLKLEAQHVLSPMAEIHPFQPVRAYRGVLTPHPPSDIPVLRQEFKPNTLDSNFFNLDYVDVSRLYARNAIQVIRSRPKIYIQSVIAATDYFFLPAADGYYFAQQNRLRLRGYNSLFNKIFLWQVAAPDTDAGRAFIHADEESGRYLTTSISLRLFFLLAPVLLIYFLLQATFKTGFSAHHILVLFCLGTCLYVLIVGNMFEIGENMRFRYYTSPYTILSLAVMWRMARARLQWP